MNKNDVMNNLRKLDDLGLPRNSYTIIYGAAMVLHGIREDTNDIDISASEEVFDILTSKGYVIENYKDINDLKYINLEISDNEFIDIFPYGKTKTEIKSQMVCGYNVQTIESLLMEKKAKGRDKDLRDVKLIEDWLGI